MSTALIKTTISHPRRSWIKTKRIVYLFEFPTASGGEQSFLEFARHLDRNGYDPIALAPPHSPISGYLKTARVKVLNRALLPRDKQNPEGWIQETGRLLKKISPDLIHANSLSMSAYSGPLGRRAGVPSVGHIRDMVRIGQEKKALLLQNNLLISVSKACTRWLKLQGIPPAKIQTIYNGIDTERLDPGRFKGQCLRKAFALEPKHVLIGAIGQIILRKGLDTLMEAIPGILNDCPQARFFIIGERFSEKPETRKYEQAIRTKILRENLTGKVFLTGWREDIGDILADLDLVIHPAKQEPLGRVLLESMSMEVPLIATQVGGTPEIIEAGETGLLIPPKDVKALTSAARHLIVNPAQRVRMGQAGRLKIQENFSIRQTVKEITECYGRLCSGKITH